jgi:hypothetical protein
MATTKQKAAATGNIKEAVAAFASTRPSESRHPMSAAVKKELEDDEFAFPRQRKEPLTDARHVRNAIARFDQVEDVSDSERDAVWRRIRPAAKKYDIEVTARGWPELFKGGKARKT